jgi:hypothetical protein
MESPLFRWDTLREVGPHDLNYDPPTPGSAWEVELVSGPHIHVWRAADGTGYFCHGLTFGGKDAPGGPISPFTGTPVETILAGHYQLLREEATAAAGDILVWVGLDPETTPHSAILIQPIVTEGTTYLDDRTLLRSKNGMQPEADLTLFKLIERYGESYHVYRRP